MNLRKLLLLTIAMFCLTAISVSFAASGDLIEASGDIAVVESGEALSGEVVEVVSGEKAEVISGEQAEVVVESGDATSGEVVAEVVSGEEAVAQSGEVAEVVSGEEAPATSGEEKEELASGDEVIIAQAKDIEDNRWYATYVNDIVAKGIMELDKDGNFNPTNKVKKADVVDAIYNLPGKRSGDEIEWAKEAAIVAEGEDLSAEATREDVAVMVYNYVKSYGGGFKGTWMFLLGYEDRDEISKEAYEAVAWCTMNDIIIGKTEETVNIQDVATRAELATIIYRLNNN